jgi:hypothetical protein
MHQHRKDRIRALTPLFIFALTAAACGSSPLGAGAQSGSTGSTAPSTSIIPSSTTTSSPGMVGQSTDTTIIDPNNYHPNYDTIAGLASTSTTVFIGTVQPLVQNPGDGGTVAPFVVNQLLLGVVPRSDAEPDITQGGPNDVSVVVGQQYLVFWGVDSSESPTKVTTCIVGGARGLFSYNAATNTVSRTDNSGTSQIPMTLTLAQVVASLPNPNVQVPTPVPSPPVCSPAVTGI